MSITIETYEKIRSLIEEIKVRHHGQKIVIGCMKKVEECMRKDGILDNHDDEIDMLHYYEARGINKYEDYNVLIVVGLTMISFNDIAKRARELFNQEWDDDQKIKQMKLDGREYKKLRYCNNGKGYEVLTYSFTDMYINEYYRHVVVSEIYQMIGRIRPYEEIKSCESDGSDSKDTSKFVYIICNVPIDGIRIDSVERINSLMSNEHNEKRKEMKNIRLVIESLPPTFKMNELAYRLNKVTNTQKHHLREVLRDEQGS